MRTAIVAGLIAILLLGSVVGARAAEFSPKGFGNLPGFQEQSPFSLEFQKLRLVSDSAAEVDFTLTAAPGAYLYQDKIQAAVKSPEGVTLDKLVMPEPKVKHDEFVGDEKIYQGTTKFTARLALPQNQQVAGQELVLTVSYQGCTEKLCLPASTSEIKTAFGKSGPAEISAGTQDIGSFAKKLGVFGPPAIRFLAPDGKEYTGERLDGFQKADQMAAAITRVASGNATDEASNFSVSPLSVILIFIGGMALVLTPCVWPMIPITTSIVLGSKKPGSGKAFAFSGAYALGLAVAYAILGSVIASAGGMLGETLQNPWVLGSVSALFVVMALSMFGLFELPLINVGAGKFGGGGMAASFVLGGVSAVVLSPCVGPVVVSLLTYVASTGNAVTGALLLFIFGLGMGTPLVAIGTFAGAMQKLPKAGGWMVEVRKLFGVAMIVFAIYNLFPLLSTRMEWIVSGAAAAILGVLAIVLDARKSPGSALGKAKLTTGIAAVAVGALLVFSAPATAAKEQGIQWYHSYPEALAAAKKQNKPLMVDFTAEWCTSCREMEKYTFSDEKVIEASHNVIPVQIDVTSSGAEPQQTN